LELNLKEKDLQDLGLPKKRMLKIIYNYQELANRLFLRLNKNQMMKEPLINKFLLIFTIRSCYFVIDIMMAGEERRLSSFFIITCPI
jgi:hypothetical protein